MRPPRTEVELIQRADALAGRRVGRIARQAGTTCPPDLRRHKGFIGELLERALGATAGARSEPDFPHLGVELKTIPVDAAGRPRQSTWVCTAPVFTLDPGPWSTSLLRRRLARVLWIPIVGDGPPAERGVGVPILWSPDPDEEQVLAQDWGQLTQLIADGEVWQWSAHHGEALQLRPKAASSSDRVEITDADGDLVETVPLGFYLRRGFTAGILAREPSLVPASLQQTR